RENRADVDITGGSVRKSPSFQLHQLVTLCRRYLTIKRKDTVGTAILLAQAPIIGLLVNMVFAGLDTGAMNRLEFMPFALFILVISSIWFGCSNAAREIVSEQAIYKRERMVNLSILAYVGSKFAVLAALSLGQCVMLLTMTYFMLDMVGNPLFHLITLWMCALAGTSLGLLLSAFVRTTPAALALVPLLLIPQVILGGAIMPIARMETPSWLASQTKIIRWGVEAALHDESIGGPVEHPHRPARDLAVLDRHHPAVGRPPAVRIGGFCRACGAGEAVPVGAQAEAGNGRARHGVDVAVDGDHQVEIDAQIDRQRVVAGRRAILDRFVARAVVQGEAHQRGAAQAVDAAPDVDQRHRPRAPAAVERQRARRLADVEIGKIALVDLGLDPRIGEGGELVERVLRRDDLAGIDRTAQRDAVERCDQHVLLDAQRGLGCGLAQAFDVGVGRVDRELGALALARRREALAGEGADAIAIAHRLGARLFGFAQGGLGLRQRRARDAVVDARQHRAARHRVALLGGEAVEPSGDPRHRVDALARAHASGDREQPGDGVFAHDLGRLDDRRTLQQAAHLPADRDQRDQHSERHESAQESPDAHQAGFHMRGSKLNRRGDPRRICARSG
ncbi:MAG: ABC transporter permease, partial [Acidobacteriota bacterium]